MATKAIQIKARRGIILFGVWYPEFIEECKAIIVEKVFNSRVELIEGKWLLGEHIVRNRETHKEELQKRHLYGEQFIEKIARSLKRSEADIYFCAQFYEKYPEKTFSNALENLPNGKNISWRKVIALLPQVKKKQNPLPKGKYNIIYADPPWKYWPGGEKNASRHYECMDLEEICELSIKDLAAENCVLFLWITFPILNEFEKVLNAWGFKYSTVGFVWVKSLKDNAGFHFGLGNWTRSNVELCVIATKGQIERKDASISQIIYCPVEEHSKKPDIVKEKIIQLVGELPRIELFARQKTAGWDVWGNGL